ncbi:MAG TPA: class I SAM-dependent methyltransferase [Gaiellaceae bacterium]|nr:class I SAM-dependent methyltransferase [Gaiellaceae bacterium]
MDDPARIAAAGYDQVADRYAALEDEGASWPRSRRVAAFARLLPPRASALDLGCGNGVPVARDLVAAGFAVTGVDVSAEQVRRAREAVPGATFLVADLRSLGLPAAELDAVVSIYALDHVPREDHADVYERIRRWLRPGGLVLLAIEDADVPGVGGRGWLGAPSYFSSYEAVEERQLVEKAGLEVLEAEVEAQVEQGVEVLYLWLVARRRGEAEYDQSE